MTQNELISLYKQLEEPLRRYKENKEKRMDPGFNVFYLISDYYYRETFHGDIIAALLSPDEKHGEGNLYIDLFIDMIKKAGSNQDINIEEKLEEKYKSCSVVKEYTTNDGNLAGRIDILIMGNEHCIVIENKLNNASDTYRQLPKYYNDLSNKKIKVDAFVYMPLDPSKEPNDLDWSYEEKKYIDSHLVIIPAFKDGSTNLINDWLIPAEERSTNEDAKFIIRQYKSLLNNLTIDIMDNSDIINILCDDKNFETTISILKLKDQFCNKIKEEFIEKLKSKLEKELNYDFSRKNKDKIEIKNRDYPLWSFIIERIGGTTNRWCRYLNYTGEKLVHIEKPLWLRENENHTFPFGWEYYGENKPTEEFKGFWDNTRTLAIMHNGTFVKEIVKEIQDAFAEIDRQHLPN